MISRKEAESILKKKYPKKRIVEVRIYKNSGYLFTATEVDSEVDYNDPYFLVGDDRKVKHYSPVEDMDNFQNARVISS